MKNALFIALGIFTVSYLAIWLSAISRGDGHRRRLPGPLDAGIGFFTNFLDTLGIGSFATTSSLFKLCSLVPDEQIPGTLNVGHTLPTVTEALLFVGLVQVDPTTLVSLIAASAVGAWREIEFPRPDCPSCSCPMTFWSGYRRPVREAGLCHKIFVPRLRCRGCGITHVLLPRS